MAALLRAREARRPPPLNFEPLIAWIRSDGTVELPNDGLTVVAGSLDEAERIASHAGRLLAVRTPRLN